MSLLAGDSGGRGFERGWRRVHDLSILGWVDFAGVETPASLLIEFFRKLRIRALLKQRNATAGPSTPVAAATSAQDDSFEEL